MHEHVTPADRNHACFFTGHRRLANETAAMLSPLLTREILSLYNERGVTDFYAGGAIGFDMLAAEAVLSLRGSHAGMRLLLALPCPDYHSRWPEHAIRRLSALLAAADDVHAVSPAYSPSCMHARNRFMADRAAYGIAWLTQRSGGTFYTVQYAAKIGCTVINLGDLPPEDPDQLVFDE